MSASALDLLRAHDPARGLAPFDDAARDAHRARILERSQRLERRRPSRTLRVAAALAAALAVGVGAAWASGLLSPLEIFENNAQRGGNPPGGIWDQAVDPSTVRRAASVQIPQVGVVDFWYGESAQGGWCGGIRLPDGEWLGTGEDKLDAGGTLALFPEVLVMQTGKRVMFSIPLTDISDVAAPRSVLIRRDDDQEGPLFGDDFELQVTCASKPGVEPTVFKLQIDDAVMWASEISAARRGRLPRK